LFAFFSLTAKAVVIPTAATARSKNIFFIGEKFIGEKISVKTEAALRERREAPKRAAI